MDCRNACRQAPSSGGSGGVTGHPPKELVGATIRGEFEVDQTREVPAQGTGGAGGGLCLPHSRQRPARKVDSQRMR